MTLLAPLFLLGLLAIGLPIWLHRLSSENPNKQAFSSLMFLEPGEPRRVLARNLQYLLLLALRIGFLCLLVLAFAGPTCFRDPTAGDPNDAALHLIVIDVSASMAHADRFELAQDEARDIIGSLGPEDLGQVIAVGRTASLLTQATSDSATLRAAVETISPGVMRLDFAQFAATLDGVIRTADRPVIMHVLTDAQVTGLPARFADLAPRGRVQLDVRAVTSGNSPNWAIESLGGSALTGELTAVARSFSDTDTQRSIELRLDDRLIESHAIDLAAGQSASVSFAPLTLRAGSNRVRVDMVPGDGLPGDDVRYIALQRPEPRPVLIVSSDLRAADTLFTLAALDTLAALVVAAETVSPDQLTSRTLDEYHFIIVTDAGGLDTGQAAALQDYVQSGGALLMALGPRATGLASIPVTSQALAQNVLGASTDYTTVGVVDTGHPALRGIRGLRAARFFRALELIPDAADTILIGLESGLPLLLERELGAGRVLVYTSTLNREWNDLVVQPAFVPFISGMANHLLGSAGFASEAPLGSTLAVRALGIAGGQIFDTAGDAALALGGTNDVLLDQIGYYEIVSNGVSQFVAVNFDTRESNLRAMDAAAIERWNSLGIAPDAVAAPIAASGQTQRQPVPMGLWLLAALAVLIVVESWAGNWHLRVQRGTAA